MLPGFMLKQGFRIFEWRQTGTCTWVRGLAIRSACCPKAYLRLMPFLVRLLGQICVNGTTNNPEVRTFVWRLGAAKTNIKPSNIIFFIILKNGNSFHNDTLDRCVSIFVLCVIHGHMSASVENRYAPHLRRQVLTLNSPSTPTRTQSISWKLFCSHGGDMKQLIKKKKNRFLTNNFLTFDRLQSNSWISCIWDESLIHFKTGILPQVFSRPDLAKKNNGTMGENDLMNPGHSFKQEVCHWITSCLKMCPLGFKGKFWWTPAESWVCLWVDLQAPTLAHR